MAAGDRLKKVLLEIADKASKTNVVKVGFQDGATYPAGEGQNPVYVAQVAFWNEYGTKRMPARPFFRSMIAQKSPKWGDNIARVLKMNNYDVRQALGQAGEAVADQLRDSILHGGWEGNADATVAQKGFDKPLVRTGQMYRDSITSELEE